MKLRDIMSRRRLVVDVSEPLGSAQSLMLWAEVRHLPVARDDRLVGLLSAMDLMAYRVEHPADWRLTRAEEVMRPHPQTGSPDDSVSEAAERMALDRIECLPITELGRVIGLVTVSDVLAAEVAEGMAPRPPTLASVADVMTPEVQTATADERLVEAAARMQRYGVRHLPVIGEDGELIGMLSDRDLRTVIGGSASAAATGGADAGVRLARLLVREVMTTNVHTTTPDEPVADLVRWFADHRVGALPVVLGRQVVGIISYVDVLRAVADSGGVRPGHG